MKHLTTLTLLLCATVSALHAAEPPTVPARPGPVGEWKWFSGRDITIHADGTVTYPGNFGVWRWTDEANRKLGIDWKTFGSKDDLTLSDDGNHLRSNQPLPGLGSDGVEGDRIVSPLGTWRMNKGVNISFREDHTAAFAGATSGFWYWTDESQRQFKVEWTTIPYVDAMTISEDGTRIEGRNHIADTVSGVRMIETPPAAPAAVGIANAQPAQATPTDAKTPGVTLVGKWRWFYGPDLTFDDDGSVTGTNRDAHWKWTDQVKREIQIDFGGRWAAYHDSLTLSENGNHLEGRNNADMHITGDRITPETTAIPASAASLLGAWLWSDGRYLTFHTDGTFVTTGNRAGYWSWTDESKGKLHIIWQEDNFNENLVLSEDGNRLNNVVKGDKAFSGTRVPREPGEAPSPTVPPASEIATPAPAATLAADLGPVGKWSWFVGPDLTFHADHTLTGENRTARWKWTDKTARQLQVTWEGVQAGLVDQLTLSTDGKHLEGRNNDEIPVSGDLIGSISKDNSSE